MGVYILKLQVNSNQLFFSFKSIQRKYSSKMKVESYTLQSKSKLFLSGLLIFGTFLGSINSVSASSSISDETVTITSVKTSQFKDFRAGQYWSEPMNWMITKGLISGYPEKNPNTGVTEYLIKPTVTLTEAQFLAIMYRYTGVDKDIKSTNTKDWANIYYQQAARDGLPTVGTLKNRGAGNLPVVRGKMAQILVSKHYDKVVSERTAVDFMYKNKISDGYNIGGTNPKTYASFGVKDKLQRAHISAFFQRYDANVKNGGGTVVTPTPVTPPPVVVSPTPAPKPPTTGVVVNGISVKYGNHAYGSKSQAEYDTVVKMATDKINSYQIPADAMTYYQRVINGERAAAGDWSYDADRLDSAYMTLKPYLDLGVSGSEALNIIKLNSIATTLNSGVSDPLDGSPRSAYDAMVRKISDCDPQSEVVSLVFDIAGYNTAIIAGEGHATPYVKIGGQWFDNAVKQVPSSVVKPTSGTYYMSTPTHGGL